MKYQNIVIDPPWPKKMSGKRSVRPKQSDELPYQTMEVEGIFSLIKDNIIPVADVCHNIFLWGIDGFLFQGESEMEKMGYRRHARFIWDKVMGFPPAFTVRYTHEYLTWFYKPNLIPVAIEQRGKFSTVIRETRRQHSRKPDAAYSMIDALYPDSNRLDVFSRESREGWDTWGNQTGHFDQGDKPAAPKA